MSTTNRWRQISDTTFQRPRKYALKNSDILTPYNVGVYLGQIVENPNIQGIPGTFIWPYKWLPLLTLYTP